MNRKRLSFLSLFGLSLTMVAACSENPVGRNCFIGETPDNNNQIIVASPALDCPSRQCLHIPLDTGVTLPEGSEEADLCTAECSSDDDCDKMAESPCQTGFTCGVAAQVGPFCCKKMCICKDYIDGDSIPEPANCDPDNPANTCVNLPGRS